MSCVIVDYSGKRFGRLLVESVASKNLWKNKNSHWICLCDCGNQKILSSSDLRSGFVNSCGCLRKERASALWVTHGNSKHPLYNLWNGMVARCRNQNMPLYPRYGGAGIDVCDRWADNFLSFVEDMGPRPSKNHSVDRIDGTKGYSPENCRWATSKEQAANKIYKIHKTTLTTGDQEIKFITDKHGIEYRRQTFTDSWGRQRVCDKRLDTLPKPHADSCSVCGTAISSERSTMRFCSDRCRVAAWRASKRKNRFELTESSVVVQMPLI